MILGFIKMFSLFPFSVKKECLEAAAAAKSLLSCPTLYNPIYSSPPGSPIPGILQARTLEWVAISFSNASKWKVKVKSLSRVWLSATPWTAAHKAPPSVGFSRQEYWSGVSLPSPATTCYSWNQHITTHTNHVWWCCERGIWLSQNDCIFFVQVCIQSLLSIPWVWNIVHHRKMTTETNITL